MSGGSRQSVEGVGARIAASWGNPDTVPTEWRGLVREQFTTSRVPEAADNPKMVLFGGAPPAAGLGGDRDTEDS